MYKIQIREYKVIRSLLYNKNNDYLIIASIYVSNNFTSLKCKTILLSMLQP
jgi:hypothetical protein